MTDKQKKPSEEFLDETAEDNEEGSTEYLDEEYEEEISDDTG